ncbi:MAG: DNA polymerase III subunit beta [Cyanobacteria bacterium P01_H01_bin.15]
MKLTCSQNDLNSQLSLVSRAVPVRPTHPVLGNVLMEADAASGQVSLTAFDLSLGICVTFPAEIEQSGTLTLPAKLLGDMVSKFPDGEISLQADLTSESDALATLTSSSGRFQLRGLGADDYPQLPVIEDGDTLTLSVATLANGLRGCLFAASPDESKQILTGVHICGTRDGLEFAATDGHRLAVVEVPWPGQDKEETTNVVQLPVEFAVTIPARALRELERMLNAHDETDLVTVQFDESQVTFALGDQRLTSRKLEGSYPAYRQLIPNSFNRQLTVERKRILSGLELVAVLADQKNNLVKFKLDEADQKLYLAVEARDVGNAKEAIAAQMSGGSLEIAFNVKYLMDGLRALPATEIQMQLNENTQPVIFSPLGETKMTYLVMPVQLRD